MSRFADSFFYYALLNPKDAAHAEAVRLSRNVRGRIITTAFVLTELADACPAPPYVRPLHCLSRCEASPPCPIRRSATN